MWPWAAGKIASSLLVMVVTLGAYFMALRYLGPLWAAPAGLSLGAATLGGLRWFDRRPE
jgi:hypothetical protein